MPIMITGHGGTESAMEAIHPGVCDLFEKPLHLESIRDGVSRVLAKQDRKRKVSKERKIT